MSFKASQLIGASDLSIIVSASSIFTVVFSILFLRESFSFLQLIGLVLILLAVYLVNLGVKKTKGLKPKGVIFGLLAALFGGVAVVSDVYILKGTDLNTYLALMSFAPGVFLIVISPKSIKGVVKLLTPRELRPMLIFAAIYAIQAITYYLAIQYGANLSQMSPIQKSSIVLTVFLSFIFLKETKHLKQKLVALGMVVLGVFLVG